MGTTLLALRIQEKSYDLTVPMEAVVPDFLPQVLI